MVSLETMIEVFGEENTYLEKYVKEIKENNGIFYLGGELPIQSRDLITKRALKSVKNIHKLKKKRDEVFNNFKVLFSEYINGY